VSRQLWGCYAVNDHLQENAFVADVLLFERLVIPVPPHDDPEALRPWKEYWQPDEQQKLLDILGGIAYQVPWSSVLRDQFQEEWRNQYQEEWSASLATAQVDTLADDERRFPGHVSPEAATLSKTLLSRDLAKKVLDQPDVQALAVYADPLKFDKEWYFSSKWPFVGRRKWAVADKPDYEVERAAPADEYGLAKLLVAHFAIPATPGRSGQDLLKEAVDLASEPEMGDWRKGYHVWIADMAPRGLSNETLVREMKEHVAAYNAAATRKKKAVAATQSATVLSTTAGMSSAIVGGVPLGIAAATPFAVVGDVVAKRLQGDIPQESIAAGALLAEAARAFGS
jgi:hypothetical protein